MIKKIALASTLLLATVVNAQIQQKGFFVGVDLSSQHANIKYDNSDGASGAAFTIQPYSMDATNKSLPSLKLGYQYYFTRLYLKVNNYEYEDTQKDRYTISGITYELNAEYVPLLYVSKDKSWYIRGVFGVGVGFNSSEIDDFDLGLLPPGVEKGGRQEFMEYGYQIGVMGETPLGFSLEGGYRFRKGHLLEYTDGTNESTFYLEGQEFYMGINYLF